MSTSLTDRLIDDARILADIPVPEALAGHRDIAADALGAFVCTDREIADLQAGLRSAELERPLDLVLAITGGAGAIGPALTHAQRIEGVRIERVESALRDEDDLARNAERIVRVLDLELPDDAVAAIELPRLGDQPATSSWWDAADQIAQYEHIFKLRSTEPLSGSEVATFVDAALDRECPVTVTGGLDGRLGPALLTVRTLLDGAPAADAAHMLDASITESPTTWDDTTAASTRRWFRSYATGNPGAALAEIAAW